MNEGYPYWPNYERKRERERERERETRREEATSGTMRAVECG
jgi:hypothetical protein